MYQLLIVDDEAYTAKVIAEGVQWERMGISTVHISTNIRRAKEVIAHHQVDLIICDIEMPQGSGLELLEWVKEHEPSIVCIFLTCHADFKYAQRAVQLGSFEYLLKPIQFPEIEKVAGKALAAISVEREKLSDRENYLKYHELWSSHEPVFIEHFWRDLLTDIIPPKPRNIREYLAKGNIAYSEEAKHLPVLIRIQRWHMEIPVHEAQARELPLQNVMKELLGEHRIKGQLVQVNREVQLLIMDDLADDVSAPGTLQFLLRTFISVSGEYLNCDLCCYVGEAVPAHEMAAMYKALMNMDADNIRKKNQVLTLSYKPLPNAGKAGNLEPPMHVWMELLKQNSEKELLSEIHVYLNAPDRDERLSAKWLREFYQNFLQIVYHVLHLKGLQAHQIFEEHMEISLNATRSIDHLFQWIQVLVRQSVQHARDVEKTVNVVEKAKSYMMRNLSDAELSREDIAAHVYLNPDYLTRIFKKETGMTISDFVVRERMELAKELLRKTNKHINSIASSIGYSNFSHFSRIFKKSTGLTPQEYRHTHDK
ncbi:response regulator [Paenibacillus sepulcri]|uniref:Response regulator n=1 Tax=Paenibacillus sepulcri TaxID=359917 RepID=A0ABS7C344_9BACL|nr:response regulator [Paenibacillus sepulcri]